MKHMIDPRQSELFDLFESFLSPLAYKTLISGWQGVFRHVILSLLPVNEIATHFSPDQGRPTKELYSMAGLLLMKEFMDWTEEEAANAYMFNADVQFALNLGRDNISMSVRTLQRYEQIFREDELAGQIMTVVTSKLISELELDVSKQRLDSTHIFSDMATFARTRLMGVAIKRFLVQLKRYDRKSYDSLPEELRNRYKVSQGGLFGDIASDKEKRSTLRQDVAEEMYFLITTFSGIAKVENRTTYKDLVTIFNQQCHLVTPKQKVDDVSDHETNLKNKDDTEDTVPKPPKESEEKKEEPTENACNEAESLSDLIDANSSLPSAAKEFPEVEVQVKKKTGGRVVQNPSDPGATYSGHKGAGYQAQIAETCSRANEVQLITYALPESSCESDCGAVEPAMDKLKKENILPDKMFADTHYGSDKNVVACQSHGVELISPASGNPPKEPPENPSEKQKRLGARRKQEQTKEWQEAYNIRAGIEATNSGLKRKSGLDRLRVRGEKSVFNVVLLKIAGWNILRAASSNKMKEKIAQLIEKTNAIPEIPENFDRIRLAVFPIRLFPRQSWYLAA
jgi:hypothetical protein